MVGLPEILAIVAQARNRPWREVPWRTRRVVARWISEWSERARVRKGATGVSARELRRALVVPLDEAVFGLGRLPFGRMSLTSHARRSAAQEFRHRHREVFEDLMVEAEDACAHRFDLLGSGPTDLGPRINWSLDFKSGFEWPRGYVKDMVLTDPANGADVKVPWDLSRGYQLIRLGQAFWLTSEERFAREMVDQWESWREGNPVLQTCNWGNAMEAAIRVCNWLAAFTLTRDSAAQTPEIRELFLAAALEHGRFIAGNLERFEGHPTSNHYLSDLVGLVYLGILTPFFKESQSWLELGLEGLEGESLIQVGPDGFDYEGSTNYHRLVGELLLSALELARQHGHRGSERVRNRVLRMAEATFIYSRPDGRAPLIGDVDNGRLHGLTPEAPDDHRSFLGQAAVAAGRPDFAAAAGRARAEGFWWGEEPAPSVEFPPKTPSSRLFEAANLAVLRAGSTQVVVHCGAPRGPRGHFHNDALGVEVSLMGLPWIVDPGTYAYTSSEVERNHFRRTEAHNTVQVDGAEINEISPGRLFDLAFASNPRVVEWTTTAESDCFVGEHQGFARLPGVGLHRRRIVLDKAGGGINIQDWVFGDGLHTIDAFLHLDPGVRAENRKQGVTLSRSDDPGQVEVELVSGWARESLELQEDWVARGYGKRERGLVVRCRARVSLPWHQETLIRTHP